MGQAVRIENHGAVRSLVLCRADEYNTITPQFREEFADALDDADTDPSVRVILIRAEGPAFCAGFGLDLSSLAQASEGSNDERVWDSVADLAIVSLRAAASRPATSPRT